jgi:hypothetical protein
MNNFDAANIVSMAINKLAYQEAADMVYRAAASINNDNTE